jgi:mono/diheme cytochrome c family protein
VSATRHAGQPLARVNRPVACHHGTSLARLKGLVACRHGPTLARFLSLVLLLFAPAAHAQTNDTQSFTLIERGRYLTIVGDCTACHTAPGGKYLAGGRAIETPFGNLVAPNITPDQATGIGGWSDEKFYNAMHIGVGDAHLYPAMPYPAYTKVTRDDVMAIRAYLYTVQPVANSVRANLLPFPFNVRAGMIGWDDLFFKAGDWQNRADKSAEWNHGGYLVEGLGHCGTCHTPKNALGGDENNHHLQGYALQGWFAPDITGDKRLGVGAWSVDDIVEYLKTGANRFTEASGPMAEEIADSTSHWTVADLHATAAYLLDQPGPNEAPPQPLPARDPVMQAGGAIFADECAACHTGGGAGIARIFPSLKGSAFVQQTNPASLLHVVLRGTRAVATAEAPTGPAMPAFDWKLSDDQVASVVTFIRNAWGNAALPVSAAEVTSVRQRAGE